MTSNRAVFLSTCEYLIKSFIKATEPSVSCSTCQGRVKNKVCNSSLLVRLYKNHVLFLNKQRELTEPQTGLPSCLYLPLNKEIGWAYNRYSSKMCVFGKYKAKIIWCMEATNKNTNFGLTESIFRKQSWENNQSSHFQGKWSKVGWMLPRLL